MTKINKLGKSTFVIAILSFLLVAVLAFGGTYAYFSATATPAGADITMGHLRIGEDGATWDTAKISAIGKAVPGQPIITTDNGSCTVDIDSNVRYFVRAHIDYSVELKTTGCNDETTGTEEACDCADRDVEVLLITATLASEGAEGWLAGSDIETNKTGYYYLNKVQDASDEVQTESFAITAKVNPEVGQVASEHFMDAVITITVTFDVIQADYIISDALAQDEVYTDVSVLEGAWTSALEALD